MNGTIDKKVPTDALANSCKKRSVRQAVFDPQRLAMFDHGKSGSPRRLQNDRSRCNKYRNQYKKPVIYDECKYEGNIAGL
jgi:hypothetical protein